MDRNDIKQVLELVRGHTVAEITVGLEGSRVRIVAPPEAQAPPVAPSSQEAPKPVEPKAPVPPTLVKAPMVGVFRRTGDTPAHGARVEAGSVIGEVESMGLRNEIVCEVSGNVTETFVEDGQPIEYGQPIIGVALDGLAKEA